jgi:uncharacterized protein YbjT (DUF2867 family)
MKVIITGSTGMVGKGVLLECIDSPDVSEILLINRNSVNLIHPKVKEIIHKDFFDWSSVRDQLSGYDACFFCLGVSSVGMKEPDYRKMTYDLTLGFAKELLKVNPGMTFCYVSGASTDSTESGKTMWARVKGKTENDLLTLGFKSAYMFRPGFIRPMRGIKSRTPLYNTLYIFIKPFVGLIMRNPKIATDSITLGKAMIYVGLHGYSKKILESLDINEFK